MIGWMSNCSFLSLSLLRQMVQRPKYDPLILPFTNYLFPPPVSLPLPSPQHMLPYVLPVYPYIFTHPFPVPYFLSFSVQYLSLCLPAFPILPRLHTLSLASHTHHSLSHSPIYLPATAPTHFAFVRVLTNAGQVKALAGDAKWLSPLMDRL